MIGCPCVSVRVCLSAYVSVFLCFIRVCMYVCVFTCKCAR